MAAAIIAYHKNKVPRSPGYRDRSDEQLWDEQIVPASASSCLEGFVETKKNCTSGIIWQQRLAVLSDQTLYFSKANDRNNVCDQIPLDEITDVELVAEEAEFCLLVEKRLGAKVNPDALSRKASLRQDASGDGLMPSPSKNATRQDGSVGLSYTVHIHTEEDGYNVGRTYIYRCEEPAHDKKLDYQQEQTQAWADTLTRLAKEARLRVHTLRFDLEIIEDLI